MQSLREEFRAQWPPCVAHEKTSTKAHEELSQRESQQQQEQEERWKKFLKNVIETVKVAERNKMPSLLEMWCNKNQSKFTNENWCYARKGDSLKYVPKAFNTYITGFE